MPIASETIRKGESIRKQSRYRLLEINVTPQCGRKQ
jgi:hypothetical protein